ncbi:MAG: bacillithiol biosynthesis deacetylase BshB1 [Acidobacteriota bacterium]
MEKLDVLAIGAHPDDVELGCGATVAKLIASGRRVGLLHLTRGEAGTRGTVEERIAEAEASGRVLGAAAVTFLDCGDGHLRRGIKEENAVIEVLRRFRPDIVLSPSPEDRHPDHGRAHRLVKDACFYAGLRRRAPELGVPHRPAAVFSYMQHDSFEPSFIVDVTDHWEKKIEALACYDSQLYRPNSDRDEPATKVASREYALAVEGRARHFGLLAGAELGEAFWSRGPLAVADLMALAPGGLR